jgi:hypothetical protein
LTFFVAGFVCGVAVTARVLSRPRRRPYERPRIIESRRLVELDKEDPS